ncbi:unnamed protein product [Rotaria magnacalcarata]|uniref:Uncharacterized protein n=2 Tax=Rotaria magnacalcarata TaxID=392030 RepID=A0A820AKC8_9BILA|nr:unnamed protein product [Rotaria magnacalcarata]CAF4203678.1 unnamed protein product [Rotaria magnacalcarata]
MATTSKFGICGFLWVTCSHLVACSSPHNGCEKTGHVCIQHPQCQNNPVCYPLYLIDEIICPPLTTARPMSGIHPNATWKQNGHTVAGSITRLSRPTDFCVDDDETVLAAYESTSSSIAEWKPDARNVRIVASSVMGQVYRGISRPQGVLIEKATDSLMTCDKTRNQVVRWSRRDGIGPVTIIPNIQCQDIKIDEDGAIYVAHSGKVTRYRRGEKQGTVVAGREVNSNPSMSLSPSTRISLDRNHTVYTWGSGVRIVKWTRGDAEIIPIVGGLVEGDYLAIFGSIGGLAVDQRGTFYLTDTSNDRIVRWPKGASKGTVIIGGNGKGAQNNQLNYPTHLWLDKHGNIFVLDQNNRRIQKFSINLTS